MLIKRHIFVFRPSSPSNLGSLKLADYKNTQMIAALFGLENKQLIISYNMNLSGTLQC
jgi:hypothetical protein